MPAFEIRVEFYHPVCHALTSTLKPAWPPDPLRLGSALVAGAHAEGVDGPALAMLERLFELPQPVIFCYAGKEATLPPVYSSKTGGPENNSRPITANVLDKWVDTSRFGLSAKNKVPKPQSRTLLEGCTLVYVVEDPSDTIDLDVLNAAARRVPYLGRSNDFCDITVGPVEPDTLPPVRLVPHPATSGSARGWAPNSLEWMQLNHQLTSSGSMIPPFPWHPYSVPIHYTQQPATPQTQGRGSSQQEAVEPSSGASGNVVPLRSPMTQTVAWRLLQQLSKVPDVVTFPCVTSGRHFSDGFVRAFGVSGPPPLVAEATLAVRNLLGEAAAPIDAVSRTSTAQPEYWQRSSTNWVSAMPLRAFPDERVARFAITKELEGLGARCEEIVLTRNPTHAWQRRTSQPNDGLTLWWCELTLAHPITGPLLLGRSTEFGFGLMINPQEEEK